MRLLSELAATARALRLRENTYGMCVYQYHRLDMNIIETKHFSTSEIHIPIFILIIIIIVIAIVIVIEYS